MAIDFDTEKGDDLETLRERLADAAAWFETTRQVVDNGFPEV
jgi:hypothetical protein